MTKTTKVKDRKVRNTFKSGSTGTRRYAWVNCSRGFMCLVKPSVASSKKATYCKLQLPPKSQFEVLRDGRLQVILDAWQIKALNRVFKTL